jgi:hypothetical protein
MLLMLVGATLLGIQGFELYHASQMVDSSLLDSHLRLSGDGGLSPGVVRLIRQRVKAEGGDPERLAITGTPAYTAYGEMVSVTVRYEQPFVLTALMGAGRRGVFHIRRTASTVSGWQP